MRNQYDFSKMKRMKNPYASRLKQPITIRLDVLTISYFKELAAEVGMPRPVTTSSMNWPLRS